MAREDPGAGATRRFTGRGDDATNLAHDLATRSRAAARSVWVSVTVNLLLATLQIVVGIYAKSQALIADGLHSTSDLFADCLVLAVARYSHRDPDREHPYGHQRFENAAALALGALLLAVGAGMLWAAFHKLQNPAAIARVHLVALWVALATLVSKELLFRYLFAVAKRMKSGMLVANAWHARSDAASSLVVAVGIVGNLAGHPLLDPLAALIVGLLIGRMGWGLGWNALHVLMDRAADDAEVAAIRATLNETPGVVGVHDVRTRKMGDMILVDAHLEVDPTLTVAQGHEIAVAARKRVMQRHRVLDLMTHIDPHRPPDRGSQTPATTSAPPP